MTEETRTPEQLPPTAIAQGTDLLMIQAPGGPVQGIELARLIGRLGPVDVIYETKALLVADLIHDVGKLAIVWGDADPNFLGYYVKTGISGAGAWVYSDVFRGFPGGELLMACNVQATQAIGAGEFTNVYGVGDNARVRKADATDPTKFANGYALAAIANGDPGRIAFGGINQLVAVVTSLSEVWLSDVVPGAFMAAPPATDGHLVQPLGPAIAGVGIPFSMQPRIIL